MGMKTSQLFWGQQKPKSFPHLLKQETLLLLLAWPHLISAKKASITTKISQLKLLLNQVKMTSPTEEEVENQRLRVRSQHFRQDLIRLMLLVHQLLVLNHSVLLKLRKDGEEERSHVLRMVWVTPNTD